MLLQEYNDQELLEQWRTGSKTAFNLLFDRYFNKLLQFTIKRIQNRELAEEIVMDVMLRLWQHLDDLKADRTLNAYLFRAVSNAIIDQLRKKALQTIDLFSEGSTALHQLKTHDTEDDIEVKEIQKIYLQTLAQLSPKRKKVFELSRHEGRSHKEISQEMDISVSTVKQHINASLNTLKVVIKDHTDIAFFIFLFFWYF